MQEATELNCCRVAIQGIDTYCKDAFFCLYLEFELFHDAFMPFILIDTLIVLHTYTHYKYFLCLFPAYTKNSPGFLSNLREYTCGGCGSNTGHHTFSMPLFALSYVRLPVTGWL